MKRNVLSTAGSSIPTGGPSAPRSWLHPRRGWRPWLNVAAVGGTLVALGLFASWPLSRSTSIDVARMGAPADQLDPAGPQPAAEVAPAQALGPNPRPVLQGSPVIISVSLAPGSPRARASSPPSRR